MHMLPKGFPSSSDLYKSVTQLWLVFYFFIFLASSFSANAQEVEDQEKDAPPPQFYFKYYRLTERSNL